MQSDLQPPYRTKKAIFTTTQLSRNQHLAMPRCDALVESDSEDTNYDSTDDKAEIQNQDTSADKEEVDNRQGAQNQNGDDTQDEDEGEEGDNVQMAWLPGVQPLLSGNSLLLWVIFNAVSGVFAIYLKLMMGLRDIPSIFDVIIILVPWCLVVVIWVYGRGSNIEEEKWVESEDENDEEWEKDCDVEELDIEKKTCLWCLENVTKVLYVINTIIVNYPCTHRT
jgi:hypothetical protein